MTDSQSTALTVAQEQLTSIGYSNSMIDLLRKTIAPKTNDQQFALFAAVVARTGLDPFARQIYAVVRSTSDGPQMTIQTGIDGYRAQADKTGEYAGSDEPVFGPPCECALAQTVPHPEWASSTVYRRKPGSAERDPYTARVYFDEYVAYDRNGSVTSFWRRMPRNQVGKCAEAAALRKAFSEKLSGVYTSDEMGQADNVVEAEAVSSSAGNNGHQSTRPSSNNGTTRQSRTQSQAEQHGRATSRPQRLYELSHLAEASKAKRDEWLKGHAEHALKALQKLDDEQLSQLYAHIFGDNQPAQEQPKQAEAPVEAEFRQAKPEPENGEPPPQDDEEAF